MPSAYYYFLPPRNDNKIIPQQKVPPRGGEGVWQCERPVGSFLCVHAAAPPFLAAEEPNSGQDSSDDTPVPSPSLLPGPALAHVPTAPPTTLTDCGGSPSELSGDDESCYTLKHEYEALLRKYENLTSATLGDAPDEAAIMFYRAASGALLLALMLSGWVHYKEKSRPHHGAGKRGHGGPERYGRSLRQNGASFGAYSQVSNGNGVVGIEMPTLGWGADDDEFPDPNMPGSRPTTGSVLRKLFAPRAPTNSGVAWTSMSVQAVSAQPPGWGRHSGAGEYAREPGGDSGGGGTREVDMAFNPFLQG